MNRARDGFDWLFRNRKTGEITIAQAPNLSLGIFLGAAVVRRFGPHGGIRTGASVIATVALLCWGVDELLRGVNPFRRLLGAGVLAAVLAGLLLR